MCYMKAVEEIKTHILCSVTFFPPENRAVYDNVAKYSGAIEAAFGNMAALCLLD